MLRNGQLPPEAVARCPLATDIFADDGDAAATFARGMTGATLGTCGMLCSQMTLACCLVAVQLSVIVMT